MRYESKKDCILCELQAGYNTDPARDIHYFDCPNCGEFGIIGMITNEIRSLDTALISYSVYKRQNKKERFVLDDDNTKWIVENETLPTVGEQIDLVIISLAKILEKEDPGYYYLIYPPEFRARIGAKRRTGVEYILHHLDGRLIENDSHRPGDQRGFKWRLTIAGWERYEALRREGIETNRAFMAMQYDSIKSVPKHYRIPSEEWDKMFEIFKKTTGKTGFLLYKLIDNPEAGLIDDRMRVEIRNSKFTIADLTFDNRGAYWESGFAEGLGKKVIYTCEKKWFDKKGTHFDTNHLETIVWERDKLDEAAEKLKSTIRYSFPADAKMTDD